MTDINFDIARENMVKSQLRTWDVFEPTVLDLFEKLPREQFVPAPFKHLAYSDAAIPLSNGHKMLPPREQARILQALAIKPTDRVLEIGCASGYLTTCFATMAHTVVSIDIDTNMLQQAEEHIKAAGLQNVTFKQGDGAKGWVQDGTFDVICLLGSVEQLPQNFAKQLNVGGRLFAIIGNEPAMSATLVTRLSETDWRNDILFETIAPRLVHGEAEQHFEF